MKYFKFFFSCFIAFALVTGSAHAAKKNQGPSGSTDEAKSSELTRQAIIKANSGAYDQSLTLFDAAVKAWNRNPAAFYNRGKVWMIQGKYDRAIGDFDKALKLNPELASGYLARGMAFRLAGDFSRSVKDFTKVLTVDSKKHKCAYSPGGHIF